MSERYTRTDAVKAMTRLADKLGVDCGYGPDQWYLSHEFKGYRIESNNGTRCPLGHDVRSARELCDAVRLAEHALHVLAGSGPKFHVTRDDIREALNRD